MKVIPILLTTLLAGSAGALAQTQARSIPVPTPAVHTEPLFAYAWMMPENRNDPAYAIYKQGKKLVFDEKWDEAQKKFTTLIAKYPKSDLVDDAAYWSAYALKHIDTKRAIVSYEKFIAHYPHSSYYDDAVADLNELTGQRPDVTVKGSARVYVTNEGLMMDEGIQRMRIGENGIIIGEGPDSLVVGAKSVTVHSDGKSFSYSYGFAPKARALERALRMTARRMNRLSIGGMAAASREGHLDPETEVKMEALYALGQSQEDDKSYETLKDVALDRGQSQQLREAALDALSEFKKHDVLSIFLQIAKTDTNPEIQNSTIDLISDYEKDRNRAVAALIEVFDALPKQRADERQTTFYEIASVGNDRAIDFLARVARSDGDYELRKDAVYYLGSIGGEKARAALYKILGGENQGGN